MPHPYLSCSAAHLSDQVCPRAERKLIPYCTLRLLPSAGLQLSTLNYDQIRSEVVGNRQQLAGCGIAEGSIQGFRAPFLNSNPQVRQVLSSNQFLYDR